jgi:hypothetical protein
VLPKYATGTEGEHASPIPTFKKKVSRLFSPVPETLAWRGALKFVVVLSIL